MTVKPSSSTRLVALLGDPVGHSLSPVFQNAAFRAAGVDGVYLALRCAAEMVPGLLRGIVHAGGAGNVTLPHKELAASLVERRTEAVERTGACNTWWLRDGVIHGDNTDVPGFSAAARSLLGISPRGARVLLLGAGGAARGALVALLGDGASEVVVGNRTPERGEALVERFRGEGTRLSAATPDSLAGQRFDLVVNATSLGLHAEDPLPLAPEAEVQVGAALDLVYAPGETRWVREQRARGVLAADGLEMLLHQGAVSFTRWWDREAPLDVMRAALTGTGAV